MAKSQLRWEYPPQEDLITIEVHDIDNVGLSNWVTTLLPCLHGYDEQGVLRKVLYCSRDGRFYVRKKDGWSKQVPNFSPFSRAGSHGGSCYPIMRNFGGKSCHLLIAHAWIGPRPTFGAPDANQQSVCGGEKPRHASPLCRLSESPQTSCSGVRSAASDAIALPQAYECDHLNGNKEDWSADNLQWVSPKENTRRSQIMRRLRKMGIDPKLVYTLHLKGIYSLEEAPLEYFMDRLPEVFAADTAALSVESINRDISDTLDETDDLTIHCERCGVAMIEDTEEHHTCFGTLCDDCYGDLFG